MPTCPRCSAPHDADARFCPACGAPLSDLPTSASGADAETLVASSSPPSLSFGSSQPAAAFAPGEMLAGRYRIVGLLGRGGMGEVYRADDLTLGIPVALKFLPAAAAADPGLVERFRAEVRSARQVSHPNVCRVYDIGEAEGRHFISMEYVDGEDLATLLRRIGRLPAPKAVEIARQVASGLAASHARGILHRDLKPANVMLDGQGQARITDFGLAVSGSAGETDLAGTPAYLAPERLAGEPATEQSDLYALGLLLYELFTGQRPFMAKSLADWRRAHSEQTPSAPSTHSGEIDPAVERLVMQCLEKDPARRPRSAAQVLMALPGGDPLAAALAAGETPSPSLVAAAGGEGGLSPGRAWLALGGFVAMLVAMILLTPAATDLGLAPMRSSPAALTERAEQIASDFGYPGPVADSAAWLERSYGMLRWLADNRASTEWRAQLDSLGAPVDLNYRRRNWPLNTINPDGLVTHYDPPVVSGDLRMRLDSRGRLTAFTVQPPRWPKDSTVTGVPAAAVFAATGLDSTRFRPVDVTWLPTVPYDERRQWEGTRAELPDLTLQLCAASRGGRVAEAVVLGPWETPAAQNPLNQSARRRLSVPIRLVIQSLVYIAVLIFAWRNVRLGRGDRRGAIRVASIGMVVSLLLWLTSGHIVWMGASFMDAQLFPAIAVGLTKGSFLWLTYMALEPFLRRRMPDLLIGWARALEGRVRDPRVGRDVLLGLVAGALTALIAYVVNGLPTWMSLSSQTTLPLLALEGSNRMAPTALPFVALSVAIMRSLGMLTVYFLMRMLRLKPWMAVILLTMTTASFNLGGENPSIEVPAAVLQGFLIAVTLVRVGPLALGALWFCNSLLLNAPLRAGAGLWYAPYSWVALLLLLGIAVWAFRAAVAGRPLFGGFTLDD
ncbi:MAG: protein kinase [Candidatus Latescibacteria bacterium]|nr:protein kinase [Candidatus Latescibacterota bacterium]